MQPSFSFGARKPFSTPFFQHYIPGPPQNKSQQWISMTTGMGRTSRCSNIVLSRQTGMHALLGASSSKCGATALASLQQTERAEQPRISFGRGQSMTSSVTDASVTDVFLTVKNRYKTPVKILASLFRRESWPLRPHSGSATAAICIQMFARERSTNLYWRERSKIAELPVKAKRSDAWKECVEQSRGKQAT